MKLSYIYYSGALPSEVRIENDSDRKFSKSNIFQSFSGNHFSPRFMVPCSLLAENIFSVFRSLQYSVPTPRSFGPELYLSLKLGYFENKRVAQLRTSSHQYNIETGRHGQNRESVVNRICTTCSKNDDDTVTLLAELPFFDPIVEDETHVIQTRPLYEDLKKKLKAPTYIVIHEDPRLLFQTSTEIRDFSRFLTNIHERRFPKKFPLNYRLHSGANLHEFEFSLSAYYMCLKCGVFCFCFCFVLFFVCFLFVLLF